MLEPMSERQHILVVEDEAAIRDGLCDALEFNGYAATGVADGEAGLRESLSGHYGLVLLDVMLPGLSGFDVCRQVRAERPALAILMLTAKGSEEDVLRGFSCGADDYVTKPFSLAQLMARVGALLRRTNEESESATEPFGIGAWQVDPATRIATCSASQIELSAREVGMLALFQSERGRIVGRRRLLVDVWGMSPEAEVQTRTVDMHIAKLRKKLSVRPLDLETVRGEGYRYRG